MPSHDTMTFTLNKTKTMVTTIAAIVMGVLAVLGGVSASVNWMIDNRASAFIKEQLDDPASQLSMRLATIVEEEMAELMQAVIDDDLRFLQLELDTLERRVDRLEDGP